MKKVIKNDKPEKKVNDKEKGYLEKIAQLEDSLMRSNADFINYKRRTDEEKLNNLKYSGSNVLLDILPVLDDFKRAFDHIPENLAQDEWVNGVIQIENRFLKSLEDIGIKKIECIGMPANHIFHEVLSIAKGKKDIILQEVEAGYMYHDKVLRPSKVIVGDGNDKA